MSFSLIGNRPAAAVIFATIGLLLNTGCNRQSARSPVAASPPALQSPDARQGGTTTRGDSTPSSSVASKTPVAPAEALAITWQEEAKNSPVPGGAGLIVCEPVDNGADEATVAFGAGCARWLHFEVAGQGELSKTPVWDAVSRASREMNRTDARLTLREAMDLAQKTGVTHLVISAISGNRSNCALTSYLLQLDDQKIVGKPLILRGTQQQVLAQLPGLAKQLALRLDIPVPNIPAKIDASPADMQLVGRLPWQPNRDISDKEKNVLVALAPKNPVAAILALASNDLDEQERFKMLDKALVSQAPENAMTYGAMAYLETSGMSTYDAEFQKLFRKYPGNYLLTAANLQKVYRFNPNQGRTAAQGLVTIAPKNPDAWLSLGFAISNETERLRRGRYSTQISSPEYASLNRLYAEWLKDVQKATELDPFHAKAWARLATAATFAGDSNLADTALWKALNLDPENQQALEWGLQMYQQKWIGDDDKLLKVANMAVRAFHYDERAVNVTEILKDGGKEMEAKRLLKQIVAQQHDIAAKNPNDYRAQYNQAWGLKTLGRFQEASDDYKAILKKFPRKSELIAEPYLGLGMCLSEMGKQNEAIAAFQTFLRKQPKHVRAHMELGYSYRQNRQPLKAIDELKEAIRLDPTRGSTYGLLGDACIDARRGADAVAAYQIAEKYNPDDAIVARNMSVALGMIGRYREAIQYGDRALQLNPNDIEAHSALAYAYGMNKQHQESANECRILLRANPNDARSHENLGDALNEMGQRKEARAEWETALRLDPNGKLNDGGVVKEARENLQKYQ